MLIMKVYETFKTPKGANYVMEYYILVSARELSQVPHVKRVLYKVQPLISFMHLLIAKLSLLILIQKSVSHAYVCQRYKRVTAHSVCRIYVKWGLRSELLEVRFQDILLCYESTRWSFAVLLTKCLVKIKFLNVISLSIQFRNICSITNLKFQMGIILFKFPLKN